MHTSNVLKKYYFLNVSWLLKIGKSFEETTSTVYLVNIN
jgi:hypothetical protein